MRDSACIRSTRAALSLAGIAWLCLCCTACQKKQVPAREAAAVRVEAAGVATLEGAALRYSGTVKPFRQVDMAFKNAGYVERVLSVRGGVGPTQDVQVGDFVRQGQVLAILRESDYRAKVEQARAQVANAAGVLTQAQGRVSQVGAGVAEAQAGLRQAVAARDQALGQVAEARAGLKQARGQVDEARAGHFQAGESYRRASELKKVNCITISDFESARANNDVTGAKMREAAAQMRTLEARIAQAQAQVTGAEGRMLQARAQVRSQQAGVVEAQGQLAVAVAGEKSAQAQLREAELALSDCSLKAPMDGVIMSKTVERGSLVAAGTVAFSLGDVRWVKVSFSVPDLEVNKVKRGQTLAVRMEALAGKRFTGRIGSVAPAADPKSRGYEVEVSVPNPDGLIRAGMIATLDVPGGGDRGKAVTVPLTALVRSKDSPDGHAVFVVETQADRSLARQRIVTLGQSAGSKVVIKSGLQAGDRVIVSGAQMVVDGDEVRVLQ